jgi:hypothetical protein
LPHSLDGPEVGELALPKAGRLPKPPRGVPETCELDCKYCALDPSSSSRNAVAVAGGFDAGLELCRNRRWTRAGPNRCAQNAQIDEPGGS